MIELQGNDDPQCTIGFSALHGTEGDVFVANSHCTLELAALDTSRIHQPGVSINHIGTEVADPSPFSGSPCPTGEVCRYSDAALIAYEDSIWKKRGRIARPVAIGSTWVDFPDWYDIYHAEWSCVWEGQQVYTCPYSGAPVLKVGSQSGLRSGTITGTCVTRYDQSPLVLLCQYQTDLYDQTGDSGAPVFRPDPNDDDKVALFGIHWGGAGSSRYFSLIDYVRSELGTGSGTCGGLVITTSTSPNC